MTLSQRVEELTISYGNDSKRAIGEFVLHQKSRLGEYSTVQIAEATYSSKSAVVRFAKALGFAGWREFVNQYVAEQRYQETHYSDVDPNIPFTDKNSTHDIIQIMCSLQMESLMDTADLMQEWEVEQTVALLKRSKRIALFGISPNNLLGELFVRRMLTIGRVVETPSLGNSGLLAASLTAEDCAIIVSYSGNARHRDPVCLLESLKANRVPVVAMTSRGDNYLRQNAKYVFSISSQEKLYSKISTFATETSIHYIFNVIFSSYFVSDFAQNYNRKVARGKLLEADRFSTQEELREDETDRNSQP